MNTRNLGVVAQIGECASVSIQVVARTDGSRKIVILGI